MLEKGHSQKIPIYIHADMKHEYFISLECKFSLRKCRNSALLRKGNIAVFNVLYVERRIIRNPAFEVVKSFRRDIDAKYASTLIQTNCTTNVQNRITGAELSHEQEAFLSLKSDDEPLLRD